MSLAETTYKLGQRVSSEEFPTVYYHECGGAVTYCCIRCREHITRGINEDATETLQFTADHSQCRELDEDDCCPKTGLSHIPDWASTDCTEDGQEVYVDVNCKDCGRNGCVGTVKKIEGEICW